MIHSVWRWVAAARRGVPFRDERQPTPFDLASGYLAWPFNKGTAPTTPALAPVDVAKHAFGQHETLISPSQMSYSSVPMKAQISFSHNVASLDPSLAAAAAAIWNLYSEFSSEQTHADAGRQAYGSDWQGYTVSALWTESR